MKMTGKIILGFVGLLLGGSAVVNGITDQLKPKTTDETPETKPAEIPATTQTTENP